MSTTEAPLPGVAGLRRDYRAHLDGIRAVAVVLVLAFHSGVGVLSSGYLGVDVFFVLSGYLVTGLLVSELAATGRVGLRGFYGRRVRRLLPMAMLVLAVSAIVFGATAAPALAQDTLGSFRAAFLYVTNWYFIAESARYLGSDIDASPVVHYWSLAIEEQFYLAWPLVMGLGWLLRGRLGARWFRLAAALTATVGLASLLLAHRLGEADPDRAYFGTDTRAYQLLAGATLALLPALPPSRLTRRWSPFLAVAGGALIVVLSTSWFEMSTTAKGTGATIGTVAALLALESGLGGRAAKTLTTPALVGLGKVSYSVYLWHILVIYLIRRQWDLAPISVFALALAVSVGLAIASGRLLETRVRRSPRLDRIPLPVIGVGLVLSIVGATLVVPAALRAEAEATDGALDWQSAQRDAAAITQCHDDAPSACIVRSGSGPSLALVGDSHVRVWQSALEVIADERDLTLSVLWLGGCSWHRDAQVAINEERQQECFAAQADWFDRLIPAIDPEIVVLVHRATFDPALPYFANLERFLESSTDTVEALDEAGRTVAILEPTPVTAKETDPLVCLSRGDPEEACGFDASQGTTPLEDRYRELDQAGLAISVDADRLMCPDLPRCDAVRDGTIVMRDFTHMTGTYSRSIAGQLDDLLVERGVLPPR